MNRRRILLVIAVIVIVSVSTFSYSRHSSDVPVPDPEPLKPITDWQKHGDRVAETAIGVGTELFLKKDEYLKGGSNVFTCKHIISEDKTAIITIFFDSKIHKSGMTLPATTPLIVDEVVVGAKMVANSSMLAGKELVLRVSTPSGYKFDILYDVGSDMKAQGCVHLGKQAGVIYLKDLEKLFTPGKFVPNNETIITSER